MNRELVVGVDVTDLDNFSEEEVLSAATRIKKISNSVLKEIHSSDEWYFRVGERASIVRTIYYQVETDENGEAAVTRMALEVNNLGLNAGATVMCQFINQHMSEKPDWIRRYLKASLDLCRRNET